MNNKPINLRQAVRRLLSPRSPVLTSASGFSINSRLKKAAAMLLSGLLLTTSAVALPSGDDAEAIEYLISFVGTSEVTFVRNFSEHSAKRAMRHMQDKYDHFEDEIDNPEEFIELCASKSLLTGREYSIIDTGGRKMLSRDWLLSELEHYRSGQQLVSGQ